MNRDEILKQYQDLIDYHYGIDGISQGWLPLVSDLFAELKPVLGDTKIICIKEKLGELRVYLDTPNEEATKIIDKYTGKSSKTCEYCGAEASVKNLECWLVCLCDQCMKFQKESRCDMFMDETDPNITMIEMPRIYDGGLFFYNTRTKRWKPRIVDLCVKHISTIHEFLKSQ